jgi:hypothetical protein
MNKDVLNDSKLFEKIEIGWFSVGDLKRKKGVFRHFYQEIVELFIENVDSITSFVQKKEGKKSSVRANNTRKHKKP